MVENKAAVRVDNHADVNVAPVENNVERPDNPVNPVKSVDRTSLYGRNGSSVADGNIITYRIEYYNHTVSAQEITITDKLSPGLMFIVDSVTGYPNPTNVVYSGGLNQVTVTVPNVPGKTAGHITLKAMVIEGEAIDNKVKNRAVVEINNTGYNADPIEHDILEPAVPVKKVSGLSSKGIDGSGVSVGDEITYAISYWNHEKDDRKIIITDKLDYRLDYVDVSVVGSGIWSAKLSQTTNTVTVTINDVEGSTGGTVFITVKVNNKAASDYKNDILNSANIKIGDNPEVSTNEVENPVNEPSVPFNPVKSVDGTSESGIGGASVAIGNLITYRISYKNTTSDKTFVQITDILDSGLTYSSGERADNVFVSGQQITLVVNDVEPGETGYVLLTAEVNKEAGGKIVNEANVNVGDKENKDTNKVENPTQSGATPTDPGGETPGTGTPGGGGGGGQVTPPTVTPVPTPAPTAAQEDKEPDFMLNTTDHYAYVVGYPDGLVRPENNITREEVVTIFFRLLTDEARDIYWKRVNPYSDMDMERWSNNAVSTMHNAGIIHGYEDGTFRPGAFITRAEAAVIAAMFDSNNYSGDDMFIDITGHWAAEYINRAALKGWLHGYGDGTFRPDEYITRAEMMTLVNQVLNRNPQTEEDLLEDMVKWPDNSDTTVWYYFNVQEATNSHTYHRNNDDGHETWEEIRPVRDWALIEQSK